MSSRRRRHPLRRVDGILLLDKPLGVTSNDALQRVRRIFRADKGGHTGSLDPLAGGLLPICLGEATKLCGVLLDGDKQYRAQIVLGSATSTGDAEGGVVECSDASTVTQADILSVLPRFLGDLQQVPPMYSALKHQGQPLYELARAGLVIDRPARSVTIRRLDLLAFEDQVMTLDVMCSKGTYIRTLAEDIAAALGQRAHLAGLRRLGAEPFYGDLKMLDFDALEQIAGQGESVLDQLLLPPASGLSHWPSQVLADDACQWLLQGGRLPAPQGSVPGRLAIIDEAGELRALAKIDEQGWIWPERCLLPPAATCERSA